VKTRPIYECRCDERLKPKDEESTHLVYTGFLGEMEPLKIETRLIDEKFASVMGGV
jgi:ribosome biogenesis SPOUT family RNA methylase Rps3